VEGRNVNATIYQIYFKDPFLAYVYLGSTPFFVALWQVFRLAGFSREGRIITPAGVDAVRLVKRCALAIICLVAVGEIFILTNDSDDRAPGVMIGLFLSFSSLVVAALATVTEDVLLRMLGVAKPSA